MRIAEGILRKNPKHINYLAPTVTYFLTLLAGTGHTAFSMIPVIVEVAKSENIKPSVPLSIAVVASQIGITASPVSAAVVAMSGFLEPYGVNYPTLLAICISTTFVGVMITAFIMSTFANNDLSSDPVYQERLAAGHVAPPREKSADFHLKPGAKTSVLIFLIGIICIVFYATAISKNIGLIKPVIFGRNDAIVGFMMIIAAAITFFCKIDTAQLVNTSTFKSGLSACVCVLGVAWLGDTFVKGHIPEIKALASSLVPAVILALGITPENPGSVYIIIASFAAVSALFVLPTYPTLLGAVQMDDTGSTRIGKLVFNHPFFIPGVLAIAISVALGFVIAPLML